MRPIAPIIALTLLSGCSNAVVGEPIAGGPPLAAKEVFGEFSTVNFCSLLTADALPAEVGERLAPAAPALDYCHVLVRMNGVEVEGQVGVLRDYSSVLDMEQVEDSRRTPPRGLKIYRGAESDVECFRSLKFADEIWLTFSAGTSGNDRAPVESLCRFADALVNIALERVSTQRVRHFIFDEKSVAAINVCDLVTPNVVADKLGQTNAGAQRYPAGHQCDWRGPSAEGAAARVTVDVRPIRETINAPTETIGGRSTRVAPVQAGDRSVCFVETEHIMATAFASRELVRLTVWLPGSGWDACVPARALAGEIWAKLPKSVS